NWSAYSGTNTNWYTDAAGTTNAGTTPTAGNTVLFSTTNAMGPTITSALGSAFTINDLQFSSSPGGVTTVTLAPGTTQAFPQPLTLAPTASSVGITVPSNAGSVSIT